MNTYKISTLQLTGVSIDCAFYGSYEYPSELCFEKFVEKVKEDQGVMFSDLFIPITAIGKISIVTDKEISDRKRLEKFKKEMIK